MADARRPYPPHAFRSLLRSAWTPANVYGFGPDPQVTDDALVVDVHTGEGDDTTSDPQVVVELVDETQTGRAAAGDGSGHVFDFDGLLQLRAIGGTQDAVGAVTDADGAAVLADDLAYQLAKEATRVIHERSAVGILDDAGRPVFAELEPLQLRGPQLDEAYNEDRWYAIQEIGYEYAEQPP